MPDAVTLRLNGEPAFTVTLGGWLEMVGAVAVATGVTVVVALGELGPLALFATTWIVYVVPFVSPVIWAGEPLAATVVHVGVPTQEMV